VIDPVKPGELPGLRALAESAGGAAQFVLRNGAELAGATLSALEGKLGRPLPPHRVIMAIEPVALAVVDGTQIRTQAGWGTDATPITSVGPASTTTGSDDLDVQDAPDDIKALLDDGAAAEGWLAADGHPLVLPGEWARDASSAQVGSALFDLVGAASTSPVAVTRDVWTGYGPTGKQGVMLRGQGGARREAGGVAVDLNVDRVTYWDGVETNTEKL
jgi:hypothetical protein